MTAENAERLLDAVRDNSAASMRPRPMTAENGVDVGALAGAPRRFNEAAADDRGKRRHRGSVSAGVTRLQ